MNSAVYACVWVRLFRTQSLLRLRAELRERAVAVMDGEPPAERVCCLNLAAHRQGVLRGMTRAEAELTGVELLKRSPQQEAGARNALLGLLHQFTPRVEDASHGTDLVLVMDIGGTNRIFGTPRTVAQAVVQRSQAIGLHANIAISANFHIAVALAASPNARIVEAAPGQEASLLAPLPLRSLPADEDMQEIFCMWGLRTFGDLATLPASQLVSRLGRKAEPLRDMALGVREHLFRPVEVVAELRETMRLDEPIELLDPLMFVLNSLLDALLRRAGANLQALAGVTATLQLDGGGAHVRRVRPALPTQDRALLLKLLQLDLNANPPPAGVLCVDLLAETGETGRTQLGLFCPQHPEPMRMDVTLSRLAALVGDGNIGHPRLRDVHHAGEFRMEKFSCVDKKAHETADVAAAPVLRRLRPPVEVATGNLRPDQFSYMSVTYAIRRVYGPWRSSGAWWSNQVWAVESWDFAAESDRAGMLLGVLTHDRLRRLWRLEALYD